MKTTERRTGGAGFLVMLATLMMLTPLSIDISLPGLPRIAAALGASPSLLQWTLSAFVLAFGIGQLLLGPLSDQYGRRPVLLAGLTLYSLAGIACTLATDARVLVALRLVQGFGACAGPVCARATAQDTARDRVVATFRQAILAAINGIAPVVAPLLGSVILLTLGWRQLYGVLAIVGIVLVGVVAVAMPETSPRKARDLAAAYGRVLRLPRTLGLVVLVSSAFAGFFSLISMSSFVLIGQLHFTATQMALAFALNALSFTGAALLAGSLVRRIDPELLLGGGVAFTTVGGALTWTVDTYFPSAGGFIATWTLFAIGMALVMPAAFAAMLGAARTDTGLAAGLLGAAQFIIGAAGSFVCGILPGQPTSAVGLLALIGGVGAAAGYGLSRPALGQHRQPVEARADDRSRRAP